MKTIIHASRWVGTFALAALAIAFMTACDFNFDISLDGKGVNVTGVGGTAENVKAKLEVSGKSCHGKVKRSFNVGDNGCAMIQFTLCGQQFNETVCGLQPGSRYDMEVEVDGGGMIAMQVPASYPAMGVWKLHSAVTGHDIPVVFSDKPFNYTPFHPFMVQPGKKLVFAKWDETLPDSVFVGELAGEFMAPPVGLDTVKVIFCGQMRFKSAVTGLGVMVGPDSNYIFAELPRTYDFSRVGAPFALPLHVAGGKWHVLSTREVADYTLPYPNRYKYIGVSFIGATPAEVNTAFTMEVNGKSVTGLMSGIRSVDGGELVIVGFDRTEFYTAADSMAYNQPAVLNAGMNTTGFPTNVAMNGVIPRQVITTGVNDGSGNQAISGGMSLSMNYPNPFDQATTIGYYIPRAGQVTVTVYDLLGNHVRTLVQTYQVAGAHSAHLQAGDMAGGSYRVELRMGAYRCSRQITLIR